LAFQTQNGSNTPTPDASIYNDSALQQQMQEKFTGADVGQYGNDYLRFKNA
jgi:hypothetical protein